MHIHTLNVDLSQTIQGENTYTCTSCSQSVVLVWNGYMNGETFVPCSWGPRQVDATNEAVTNANINYL